MFESHINVVFAWYVTFYLFWLAYAPLTIKLATLRKNVIEDLAIIIIAGLIISYVTYAFGSIGFLDMFNSGLVGVFFAKYNVFNWFNSHLKINFAIFLLLLAPLIILQTEAWMANIFMFSMFDGILAGIFIWMLLNIIHRCRSPKLASFLGFVGIYSTGIWYLHGIFFTGRRILQPIIYLPQYWLLCLTLALSITLLMAMAFSKIERPVLRIIDKWFSSKTVPGIDIQQSSLANSDSKGEA